MLGAMDFGIADDGERTSREQAAQIAIAAFADIAEPVLASRFLSSASARARSRPRSPALTEKPSDPRRRRPEGSPRPDPRQVYRAAGLPRWIGAKSYHTVEL